MRRWAMARARNALTRKESQTLAARLQVDSDDGVMLAALPSIERDEASKATLRRVVRLAVAGNRGSRRAALRWLGRGGSRSGRTDSFDGRIRAGADDDDLKNRPAWIGGRNRALQDAGPEAR